MGLLVFPLLASIAAWGAPNPPLAEAPLEPPSEPSAVHWVQLASGEWLNGEVKTLRSEVLEFDSDKLDLVKLDWDDVTALYVAESFEWITRDHSSLIGPGVMWGNTILVRTADGVQAMFRDDLNGLISGTGREIDRWDFYARIGFDGSWGNSPQTTLSIGAGMKRQDALTRWTLDYLLSAGTTAGERTVGNHRATTALDFFVTPTFYVRAPLAEYFADPFQNIRHRVQVGAGVGVRYEPGSEYELGLTLSGLFQYQMFDSVEVGEDPTFQGAGAAVSAYQNWEVTSDIDFDLSWTSVVIFNDLGRTNHHGEALFDHDIWRDLEWFFKFVFDRTESPPPLEDGTVLKKNDYKLVVGISIEF